MTTEHYNFLKANRINFETVALGYTKNLPMPILTQYEAIYRAYISEQYILTPWCSSCVFDMLKRIKTLFEQYESQNQMKNISETA